MNKKVFNKNIISFYIAFIFITIASSLPHSVLTVLLFQKGLSLSQIMIVQAVYSLAILISEYPSGLLADIYSKKNLFIISKFFLILMFILVLCGKNIVVMSIAWFFYGISSALDSGTIDAEIINDLKTLNQENKVSKFISNTNRFNFISLLIGSTFGSWIYYRIGIRFYFISILLTILSILIIQIFYLEHSKMSRPNNSNALTGMLKQINSGITELKGSFDLKLMIALTFVSQFFFQTHYQIWQALFLFKGFNKKTFFIYYIIFQLISFIAYSIPFSSRSINKKSKRYLVVEGLIMIIGLISIPNNNKIIFLVSYLMLVFVFTFFDYFSNVLFSEAVSIERISSLTSLKSSCGRIASLISMMLSSFLLNLFSVSFVVTLNFACAIISSLVVISIFVRKQARPTPE